MSYNEDDDWLGGFGLDDGLKCPSPMAFGGDTSLNIPMRDSPSPSRDLHGIPSYNDSSLTIPMQDYPFVDAPQLSMHESISDVMLSSTEVPYNSFEQPSMIVNGHAQQFPLDLDSEPPLMQQHYYQNDQMPSTSTQSQHQPPQLQQQQHPSSQSVQHRNGDGEGSLMQQMLTQPPMRHTSTPSTSQANQRHTPQPQQPRTTVNRPIQPAKVANGRKKAVSHSTSNNRRNDGGGGGPQSTAISLTPEQSAKMMQMQVEITQLEQQQEQFQIDNRDRINELQKSMAAVFLEGAMCSQVDSSLVNEIKQVSRGASNTRRSPHQSHQQQRNNRMRPAAHLERPDSPQYQPQSLYLSSQYPSTSTATFNDYTPVQQQQPPQRGFRLAAPQHVVQTTPIVHQQQPSQQDQSGSYQQQSQQPTTVYVQNVQYGQGHPQQQATVGQLVRLQPVRGVRHAQGGNAQQIVLPSQLVKTSHNVVITQRQVQQIQHQSHPQQHHVLQQQQHQPPQQVQHQPQPQPLVIQRPTAAQSARRMEEKRASRFNRCRDGLGKLSQSLENPDTETPFKDNGDVLRRLLPYHIYNEPDIKPEVLEQVDTNIIRSFINLDIQRESLERGIRKVFYDQAAREIEKEEQNLLLFLDAEYERSKLEQEKAQVAAGDDSFEVDKCLALALRDSHLPIPQKDYNSHSKTSTHHWEYYPFTESARPCSPYKSPSPFKSPASNIRSLSPIKSPQPLSMPQHLPTHSPRLRNRFSGISRNLQNQPNSFNSPQILPSTPQLSEVSITPMIALPIKETQKQRPPPKPRPDRRSSTSVDESIPPMSKQPSATELKKNTKQAASKTTTPTETKQTTMFPTKKNFLSRAREGLAMEFRSPSVQNTASAVPPSFSRYSNSISEENESDGSASPELGFVDDYQQSSEVTAPVVLTLTKLATPALPPQSTSKQLPVTSADDLNEIKKADQTQVNTTLRAASPKKENALITPKLEEKLIEAKVPVYRFKPQVPRPSSVDSGRREQEKPTLAIPIKITNSITATEQKVVEVTVKPPPLKLTLKREAKGDGWSNLNLDNSKKEDKEERHRRKKAKKERREKRKRKREEQMNGHKDDSDVSEIYVSEASFSIASNDHNGLRLKLKKLNGVASRTSTPIPSNNFPSSSMTPVHIVNHNNNNHHSRDKLVAAPKLTLKIKLAPKPAPLPPPPAVLPLPFQKQPLVAPLRISSPVTFSNNQSPPAGAVEFSSDESDGDHGGPAPNLLSFGRPGINCGPQVPAPLWGSQSASSKPSS